MRDRKKRNIIIGALCSLLVFMGIGYAILSQTLNISGIANMRGNWNVKITNMELLSENKTGRAEEVSHSFTDTTATFEADLYMPGDSIEYRVTVENQGNIDALLKSITPTTTNRSEGIKFSHSEIDNTVLTAGKKITFTMKVEFLESATSIPKVDNVKYNLELVYVQYNGGEYTPATETTEEDCFWITDDGTLLSYDESCGTDNVVIPAKVNGIPVKRTLPYFLLPGPVEAHNVTSDDWSSLGEDDDVHIVKNKKEKDKYLLKLIFGYYSFDEALEDNKDSTEAEKTDLKKEYESLINCLEKNICDSAKEYFGDDIETTINSVYVYGSDEYNSLKLAKKRRFLNILSTSKIYRDTDNSLKYDSGVSNTEGNIVDGHELSIYGISSANYCKTQADCELGKEYIKNFDPAREKGITEETYYESVGIKPSGTSYYSAGNWYTIDSVEDTTIFEKFEVFLPDIDTTFNGYGTVDFSNAIYMEDVSIGLGVGDFDSYPQKMASKVIMPPNIEYISPLSVGTVDEVIFPKNSVAKTIGYQAFNGVKKITIPSSVVSIAAGACMEVADLSFDKNSKLVAIYGNYIDDGGGAFQDNTLTSLTLPASLEYIGDYVFTCGREETLKTVRFEPGSKLKYMSKGAFSSSPKITLTTATDLSDWPAGDNVIYER